MSKVKYMHIQTTKSRFTAVNKFAYIKVCHMRTVLRQALGLPQVLSEKSKDALLRREKLPLTDENFPNLKEVLHEIFNFSNFRESVSSRPQCIPWGLF